MTTDEQLKAARKRAAWIIAGLTVGLMAGSVLYFLVFSLICRALGASDTMFYFWAIGVPLLGIPSLALFLPPALRDTSRPPALKRIRVAYVVESALAAVLFFTLPAVLVRIKAVPPDSQFIALIAYSVLGMAGSFWLSKKEKQIMARDDIARQEGEGGVAR